MGAADRPGPWSGAFPPTHAASASSRPPSPAFPMRLALPSPSKALLLLASPLVLFGCQNLADMNFADAPLGNNSSTAVAPAANNTDPVATTAETAPANQVGTQESSFKAGFEAKQDEPVALPPHADRVDLTALGGDRFTARIKNARHVWRKQENDEWCWAAAAEMLHSIRGSEVTQREVVERVQGIEALTEEQRRGANYFEIIRALTPELRDYTFADVVGLQWDAQTKNLEEGSYPKDLEFSSGPAIQGFAKKNFVREKRPSIEDLKNGYGSLVGLSAPESATGHIYVMVGATFTEPSDRLRDLIAQLEELEKNELLNIGEQVPGLPIIGGNKSPKQKLQKTIDTLAAWRSGVLKYGDTPEAQMALGQLGVDLYKTESVVLLDPWKKTAEEGTIVMGGDKFLSELDFVLTSSDAQEIAEAWLNSIEVETEEIEGLEDGLPLGGGAAEASAEAGQ